MGTATAMSRAEVKPRVLEMSGVVGHVVPPRKTLNWLPAPTRRSSNPSWSTS